MATRFLNLVRLMMVGSSMLVAAAAQAEAMPGTYVGSTLRMTLQADGKGTLERCGASQRIDKFDLQWKALPAQTGGDTLPVASITLPSLTKGKSHTVEYIEEGMFYPNSYFLDEAACTALGESECAVQKVAANAAFCVASN